MSLHSCKIDKEVTLTLDTPPGLSAHLRTYPRRTPLSCGSGGGCHWTMMDWLVRPLATMFLGGALGASSRSINLAGSRSEGRVSAADK